ncbi:thioredoxin reductase-like selenoprotein T1a [Lates japonicus]|uniref:Selenoprotein T n=1 Tax=Lates japonicus TaxID=270547 RepID=A0AAD3R5W5_LATJO|nr:thioredoxin reductase-like selenoprotein T1a [Lates japonicus]
MPIYRHIASFLSMFKLLVIGLIIIGRDPFALFGMQAPGIWEWGQGNKIYACMMVFFFSNMIENQLMSTGAFEITLNDVPVWSKLESAKSPSMFEVGFSLGCEVMFMKVCAEGRKTASTDWMPPSFFTMLLRDIPPLTPEWDPWQQCRSFCHFLVLFLRQQTSSSVLL